MTSYGQLFLTILPVFTIIALGFVLRRVQWIAAEAEGTLLNLALKVAFPCLIFESVVRNPALQQAGNVVLPPLLGFGLTVAGFGIAWYAGGALGLKLGAGRRTFALTAGLANYGYLPLPIADAMFGPDVRAVLLVHNIGVEAAIWSAGILLLSGLSPRAGWRRLLNMPLFSLVFALAINLGGVGPHVPRAVLELAHALGACAIPLGLLMTGASLEPHLGSARQLVTPRVSLAAGAVRLGLTPLVILAAAAWLPLSPELRRVLVLQAAMPSAVIPIILARVYGGQPLVAVQIVLATTVLALFTIPLWIQFGLRLVGG
ncbi:MAG TPA: AEC family transporter [Opitutaceae bacterium]|nr:AEC family transporter [Opitutaceae bacterium]